MEVTGQTDRQTDRLTDKVQRLMQRLHSKQANRAKTLSHEMWCELTCADKSCVSPREATLVVDSVTEAFFAVASLWTQQYTDTAEFIHYNDVMLEITKYEQGQKATALFYHIRQVAARVA